MPAPDDEIGADRLGGRGDELYAALLAAHEGLSEAESHRLNARLVLLLANALGEVDVAKRLFAAAREGVEHRRA